MPKKGMPQQQFSDTSLRGVLGVLTFHDLQLEIKRLTAKEARQQATLERTRKLIAGLKDMQKDLPQ